MRGYSSNESAKQELFEAIQAKDLVKIRSILQKVQFIDLNTALNDTSQAKSKTEYSYTKTNLSFFEQAILSKNIEIVKLLLEYGANPNHTRIIHYIDSTRPILPVELAFRHLISSNKEIFDLLLEKTSKTLIEHSQLLHHATKSGKFQREVTAYYLQNNIPVNSIDQTGKTALDYALKNGFFIVSKDLFDAGATTSLLSEKNPTPAIFYLIRHFNQNQEFLDKYLTRFPEDINAIDQATGNSLIHEAVIRKKVPALKILSEKGAKLDIQNKEGKSPALIALEKKSYNILDKLLHLGANPDLHYHNGETLLHIASKSDDRKAMQILQKYTTNPLALDCENKTAWEYGNHSNYFPSQLEIRSQSEYPFEKLDCPKAANDKAENSFNYMSSIPVAAFMIIVLSCCLRRAFKTNADHKKHDDLQMDKAKVSLAR